MSEPFHISEFIVLDGVKTDIPLPPETVNKIVIHHMIPLRSIRFDLGIPIYIRSCLRPKWWETLKGRDGSSQHTFGGLGACDVSLERHSRANQVSSDKWRRFFDLLSDHYSRIAWYPNQRFLHCDHLGDKLYFITDVEGKWGDPVSKDDLIHAISGQEPLY